MGQTAASLSDWAASATPNSGSHEGISFRSIRSLANMGPSIDDRGRRRHKSVVRTFRTCRDVRVKSVLRRKADVQSPKQIGPSAGECPSLPPPHLGYLGSTRAY